MVIGRCFNAFPLEIPHIPRCCSDLREDGNTPHVSVVLPFSHQTAEGEILDLLFDLMVETDQGGGCAGFASMKQWNATLSSFKCVC